MNVLMLTWKDFQHPAAGGAEVVTDRYLSAMARAGHSVTLFTAQAKGQKDKGIMNGYQVIRSGGRFSVYMEGISYLVNHKNEYDVVIDQINTIPFFSALVPMQAKRITFIHQLAKEYWFTEVPFVGWLGWLLEPVYLQLYRGKKAITVSESTAKDLRSLGFKDITVIPNGYDGPFVTKAKKKQFCFVARLVKAKGVMDAIDAFQKAGLTDYKLIICGSGPLAEEVRSVCDSDSRIVYCGHVSGKEKLEIMAESVALLFPSVREGFGLTVLEAAACGTPTIGYDVAGLRDTVKANGTLVKDKEGMAQAMKNYAKRRPSAKACQSWAKQFDWKRSEEKWLEEMKI